MKLDLGSKVTIHFSSLRPSLRTFWLKRPSTIAIVVNFDANESFEMTVRFDFEPYSKYSIYDAQSDRCDGNIENLYRALSISSVSLRPFIFTRVINRLSQ